MTFSILVLPRAKKELAERPVGRYKQVRDAIRSLSDDPRPSGCRKLSGREGWRIRAGDYRVIYEIDETQHTITILHVSHRRNVYR